MEFKKGDSEAKKWQHHARQIQTEAIANQLIATIEDEMRTDVPLTEHAVSVLSSVASGQNIDLHDLIGEYENGSSDVLKVLKFAARKHVQYAKAVELARNCNEEVKGTRDRNLRDGIDSYLESVSQYIGGYRNEPIAEAVQDGWDEGIAEFLTKIEGETPLLPYSKKLLLNLPVRIEYTIIGEKLFYLSTRIPNVSVKYWYPRDLEKPQMGLRVEPF